MRIYNGTKSQLNLPLAGNERITIPPMSPSGNVMCSTDFLSLLITSYTSDEVALIVSGPFEINACASIPLTVDYVVQSLDEAIQKFAVPTPAVEEKKEEKKSEPEQVQPKEETAVAPVVTPEEPKKEVKTATNDNVHSKKSKK